MAHNGDVEHDLESNRKVGAGMGTEKGDAFGNINSNDGRDGFPPHLIEPIIPGLSDRFVDGDQRELNRGLKSRHIQFLALGGAIGTGFFVGSGRIISVAGPEPLLLAYLVMIMIVWSVMNVLGEISTYLPFKGISIPYYVERFVEPSLAFAAGWNYWYAYSMLVGAEASAGAIVLDYWKTPVPAGVWIALMLIIVLALNLFAVKLFGEAEFWFASVKVIMIIVLIITGLVIMLGGAPDEGRIGFRYWRTPGAHKDYLAKGSLGHFLAFWTSFVRSGFAFITSPELIALAAGETMSPRRNIPKATRRFVWRLGVFYGVGALILGCLVPFTDENLLSPENNANASPWVIGVKRAGIKGLDHVINAAILTSAWSAGNSFLYAGSRVLYGLAIRGQAPRFLTKTTRQGSPVYCVLVTWAIGLLAFLNVNSNAAEVFEWFMNISTISGYIAWIVILIMFLRFRAAMRYHGAMGRLSFKGQLQPYSAWVVLPLLIILTLTNGFQVFVHGQWNVKDFLAAYITLPIFAALYFGHKIFTRGVWAKKLADIDVTTGVAEMEHNAAIDPIPIPKNFLQRLWFWVA